MKEGNYSPCQMANKRSMSLSILETRQNVCRPCNTYHEQSLTAQGLLPCNDSECRGTALNRSSFFSKSPQTSPNSPGKQQRGGNGHVWAQLWAHASRLGLLFINVIFHGGILYGCITNTAFTPVFGMVKVPLEPYWSSARALWGIWSSLAVCWAHSQKAAHQKPSPSTTGALFLTGNDNPCKAVGDGRGSRGDLSISFVHLSGSGASLLYSSMRDGFFPNAHQIKI